MDEVRQKFTGGKNPRTAGLSLSVCTLTFLFAQVIVSLIISGAAIGEDTDAYKYLSYLSAPVGIAVGIIITLAFSKQKISDAAPVKCNFKYYIIALLMIFGLTFSLSGINSLIVGFLKLFGYVPRPDEAYVPSLNDWLIVPAVFTIAFLPAVFEEFLFRGMILRNAQCGAGDILAIVFSGLSFALFHGSAEQTVYQFICGCSFAFLAVRSGSILPCMLMHFLNNAAILIMYSLNFELSGTLNIIFIAVGAGGGGGAAPPILWLALDKKHLSGREKGGASDFFKYASAGIIILMIFWVMSLFVR